MSETIVEHIDETFKTVVTSRMEPNAATLINTTRWQPSDLPGRAFARDGAVNYLTGEPYDALQVEVTLQ